MNIKEYISSGTVESYVLGLASEQERAEFEKLCIQYPELEAARYEFEIALEKAALQLALQPAGGTKEKVMASIRTTDSTDPDNKVIPMHTRTRNNNWLRYVAAASVILLLVSAWFVYDQRAETRALREQVNGFQARIDSINAVNEGLTRDMEMIKDPNVAVVSMVGTQKTPSSADVYWDSTSTNVFLVVKNMPQLPSEKQYQLWAFIEGKPYDLGLFDAPSNNNVILKMKNTRKADAFAITIERRGNGPDPQGPVETYGKKPGL